MGESVQEAVRLAMEAVRWEEYVPAGADVALKINLTHDMLLPGSATSPWVIEGVVQAIRKRVGEIYLVESDQVLIRCDLAFRRYNLEPLLRRYGLHWHNLSRGEYEEVERELDGVVYRFHVPKILRRLTVITLPVLKTHFRCLMSGALKNQYGCLEDERHNFHDRLAQYIGLINDEVRPVLAVMDGTVGMEGNGPKSGRPRVCDLVLASSDLVALDAVACRLMGFDPRAVEHIVLAQRLGLGSMEGIRVEGEDPEACCLHFQPPRENFVAKVEGRLRRLPGQGAIFRSGLLKFFTLGARGWYWIWYHLLEGRRFRNTVLATRYGAQYRP